MTSFTGRDANSYGRKLLGTNIIPANLEDMRRGDAEIYSKFLTEIGNADYDTLKACIRYPNAILFLLNTGREGIWLIDATDGQVIVLSWQLDDEEQKKLPATFRHYHGLADALKYCGAKSYFAANGMARSKIGIEALINHLGGIPR